MFYLFGIIFICTHFNLLFIPLPFLLRRRPNPDLFGKMSAFGRLYRPLFNNTHLYNIIYGSGHASSGPKSKSHRWVPYTSNEYNIYINNMYVCVYSSRFIHNNVITAVAQAVVIVIGRVYTHAYIYIHCIGISINLRRRSPLLRRGLCVSGAKPISQILLQWVHAIANVMPCSIYILYCV